MGSAFADTAAHPPPAPPPPTLATLVTRLDALDDALSAPPLPPDVDALELELELDPPTPCCAGSLEHAEAAPTKEASEAQTKQRSRRDIERLRALRPIIAYPARGHMSKRLAFLEKTTKDGSKDPLAWYGLALEYANLGRLDDALATFEALKKIDAAYVPMYLMAGQHLATAGRKDEARAWLEEGIAKARAAGNTHALGEMENVLASL